MHPKAEEGSMVVPQVKLSPALKAILLGASALLASPAAARVLTAGPNQEYDTPSRAIQAAAAGDTISIAPGTYYDCAIATVPLTIEGRSPGVVLTDRTCEGKAILVLRASDVVVRNLTLARARVPDGNGAGIRLEGQGLTLDQILFDNDEVGLLAAPGPGRIVVTNCEFKGGGVGGSHPLALLFVERVAQLVVTRSRFTAVHGVQLVSAADLTELRSNVFDTGPEARGMDIHGALIMEANTLIAGPGAAVGMIRADGGPVTLRRNQFTGAVLLQDWTGGTPVLAGNELAPGAQEVSTDGYWRHRVSTTLHGAKDGARSLAGQVKRGVLGR